MYLKFFKIEYLYLNLIPLKILFILYCMNCALYAAKIPYIQSGTSCESYITQQENLYKIPQNLLKAISLVESGKTVNKKAVAWPWTINVYGKGYVFSSKQEAIQAVKDLQKLGIKSIDVGCMQVNLKHHPNAFLNLEDAFDPQKNVNYAANFLTSLYNKSNDWLEAVGHYHSHTPKLYKDYQNKVINRWKKISHLPSSRTNTNNFMLTNQNCNFNLNDIKKELSLQKKPAHNVKQNIVYRTVMKKTFIPLESSPTAKHYIPLDNNLQNRNFIPLS